MGKHPLRRDCMSDRLAGNLSTQYPSPDELFEQGIIERGRGRDGTLHEQANRREPGGQP
jgi:hypothetical protein